MNQHLMNTFIPITALLLATFVCCIKDEIETTNIKLYESKMPKEKYELHLKNAWKNGDHEAGGHLIFAWTLGLRLDQDLKSAVHHSNSLASEGATRAYTTLALLQNHNLMEDTTSDQERTEKAMDNYAIAAIKGDPLAQIIFSDHSAANGDCLSALIHAKKAASSALRTTTESEISTPGFVNYVLPEDSPLPHDLLPSQEKLHFMEHLALYGDGDSAIHAAILHLGGSPGIQRNVPRAIEMLEIGVKENNTFAMVWLSQLYLRGMAEMKSEDAFNLLQKALKYGNPIAYSALGSFYLGSKRGFSKNIPLAVKYFKKGMDAGNAESFYQLGNLYNSKEFNNNTARAAELWRVPASVGHIYSSWRMAEYYYNLFELYDASTTLHLASGFSKASEMASLCELSLTMYRVVALSGEWKNIFNDAYEDYLSGRKASALVKYFLLSDIGYKAAHINAARILAEGSVDIYGKNEDSLDTESLKVWTRVAQSKLPIGYTQIGNHYYYGKGASKNLTSAIQYYEKAYEAGDAEGGFNLALALEWGQGVKQNVSLARLIFNSTSSMGADAFVPVFLAVARLEGIEFFNHYFGYDFHDSQFYARLQFPDWDFVAIIFLIFVIIFTLYLRRQL